MRSIELQTTQNVLINYELASLRDRILAFVIDFVAVFTAVVAIILMTTYVFYSFNSVWYFVYLITSLLFTFYTLLMEWFNRGQTLGKMALRIQVVRLDGNQMVFTDHLLRWVFRLIDIWFSFGAIAVVMISSSSQSQRLGNIVSKTVVVRTNPRLEVSLKELLRINTSSDYEPVYPAVKQFRESDMLTIKQTLDRYGKYRNGAHRDAISEASLKASELLGLPEVPPDQELFLRTLVKDYIVLTR